MGYSKGRPSLLTRRGPATDVAAWSWELLLGEESLSLQGRALGVQPGESLQEQKGHGLGSPGLSLL